jgi:hypothetical protein
MHAHKHLLRLAAANLQTWLFLIRRLRIARAIESPKRIAEKLRHFPINHLSGLLGKLNRTGLCRFSNPPLCPSYDLLPYLLHLRSEGLESFAGTYFKLRANGGAHVLQVIGNLAGAFGKLTELFFCLMLAIRQSGSARVCAIHQQHRWIFDQLLPVLCDRDGQILLDATLPLFGCGKRLIEPRRQSSASLHVEVLEHDRHFAADAILDLLFKPGKTGVHCLRCV